MLELKDVTKVFNIGSINENAVLHNLDLDIHEGDFISIIGSNGAGKSTLLNVIAGVYHIDGGKFCLTGRISRMPEHKGQGLSAGFPGSDDGTSPSMTIAENLAFAYCRDKRRGLQWGMTNPEKGTGANAVKAGPRP